MLIVFEGIDFAGKTTQVKLLADSMKLYNYTIRLFSFPSISSSVGRLLRSILTGGEGALPHEALFALFTVNRLEAKPEIVRALEEGHIVLCDRYSPSEIAYGGARGLSRNWLESLESPMPPADIVFLLDIDYDIAVCRRPEKRSLDAFERDAAYLREVRREYLSLARRHQADPRWVTLDAQLDPGILHMQVCSEIVRRAPGVRLRTPEGTEGKVDTA